MTSFGDSFPLGLIADAQIKNDGPRKNTIIPLKKTKNPGLLEHITRHVSPALGWNSTHFLTKMNDGRKLEQITERFVS